MIFLIHTQRVLFFLQFLLVYLRMHLHRCPVLLIDSLFQFNWHNIVFPFSLSDMKCLMLVCPQCFILRFMIRFSSSCSVITPLPHAEAATSWSHGHFDLSGSHICFAMIVFLTSCSALVASLVLSTCFRIVFQCLIVLPRQQSKLRDWVCILSHLILHGIVLIVVIPLMQRLTKY